jgi:hypothetical protein
MKFIFADALDQVDPEFDFQADESAPGRKARNDLYPHELFKRAPYDGVLISRGIVGSSAKKGKYSDALAMQLTRDGARSVLRMHADKFREMPIFGDCGAFSYHLEKVPPYSPANTAEFYADGQFTHGCSPDHIIFEFRKEGEGLQEPTADEKARYEITQSNARAFLQESKNAIGFTPVGVAQGWSPASMALAAKNLEKMGYGYIALGGMVPLDAPDILLAVREIRRKIRPSTKIHILGFAKADDLHTFKGEGVDSFDSTSPLTRAFKDATRNYYAPKANGGLDYYTAIRVPQSLSNNTLKNAVREGSVQAEMLAEMEESALRTLRLFDQGKASYDRTAAAVQGYLRLFYMAALGKPAAVEKRLSVVDTQMQRTLGQKPWKSCRCEVCREAGVEVTIFRSSNRNKRRGFHNLHVYYEHLNQVRNGKQK